MRTVSVAERLIKARMIQKLREMSIRSLKSAFYRRLPVLRLPGVRYVFQPDGFQNLLHFLYCRKIKRHNSFMFQGETYRYFDTYKTWLGERVVEIPIVMEMVRKYSGQDILEIGNVLSNHTQFKHDVLDKYDITKGVINEDVVDFKSKKKYDLIVSISTLEHVGWDETPKDTMKVIRAIENLKTLIVSRRGTIVITLPIGFNSALDKLLREYMIHFSKQYQLMRVSKGNEWKEVSWKEVQEVKYNAPFPFANGLVIGIIEIR